MKIKHFSLGVVVLLLSSGFRATNGEGDYSLLKTESFRKINLLDSSIADLDIRQIANESYLTILQRRELSGLKQRLDTIPYSSVYIIEEYNSLDSSYIFFEKYQLEMLGKDSTIIITNTKNINFKSIDLSENFPGELYARKPVYATLYYPSGMRFAQKFLFRKGAVRSNLIRYRVHTMIIKNSGVQIFFELPPPGKDLHLKYKKSPINSRW